MRRSGPSEVLGLMRAVQQALREELDPESLLPLLARLARAAAPDSDEWLFAHRHLAEIGVEFDPWRAALFARRVLARRPDDDGAWAVLGLAQSLLGNCRYAVRAYERALAIAPDNPWYAHNLGHLYDVALGRPEDAVPLLAQAVAAQPEEPEIGASYAHALGRTGEFELARRVLRRATRRGSTPEHNALARWLDRGAKSRGQQHGSTSLTHRRSPSPRPSAGSGPCARATKPHGACAPQSVSARCSGVPERVASCEHAAQAPHAEPAATTVGISTDRRRRRVRSRRDTRGE